MSEQSLSNILVDVAIKSLQRQVEQLKRIVSGSDDVPVVQDSNEEELKQEIKLLRIANEKAEYRIRMLLRALEEKDKKQ